MKIDSEEFKQMCLDAERYRFLRDEDNWKVDEEEDYWEILGESTGKEFDKIVDNYAINFII